MKKEGKTINKTFSVFMIFPPIIFWTIIVATTSNNPDIELVLKLIITHLLLALLGFLLPITFLKKYLSRLFFCSIGLTGLGLIIYFIFLHKTNPQSYNEIFLNSLIEILFIYLIASGFFLTSYIKLIRVKNKKPDQSDFSTT